MTDSPISSTPTNKPLWTALGLAWEFGYLIALPLVIFGLGGRWLDRQLGTSPWLLLGGMAVAITLTTIFLVRKFSKMIRQAEQSQPPNKTA